MNTNDAINEQAREQRRTIATLKARLAEQSGYGWSKEAKKYWSNLADQLDGAAVAVREAVSGVVREAVKGYKPPKAAAKPKSTKRRKNAVPRQRPAIVQAASEPEVAKMK
jgi:hypothetical protein